MSAPDRIEVLLVEDNPEDAEMTLRAFARNEPPPAIHRVRDGVEAWAFLSSRKTDDAPKLVLLDLKLPRVDGFEVLRKMRDDPRTRRIPVVVLSSSTEDRDVEDSYALGANSYVTKPPDFRAMIDLARELFVYWLRFNRSRP